MLKCFGRFDAFVLLSEPIAVTFSVTKVIQSEHRSETLVNEK